VKHIRRAHAVSKQQEALAVNVADGCRRCFPGLPGAEFSGTASSSDTAPTSRATPSRAPPDWLGQAYSSSSSKLMILNFVADSKACKMQ
jgi:hypothetical protein